MSVESNFESAFSDLKPSKINCSPEAFALVDRFFANETYRLSDWSEDNLGNFLFENSELSLVSLVPETVAILHQLKKVVEVLELDLNKVTSLEEVLQTLESLDSLVAETIAQRVRYVLAHQRHFETPARKRLRHQQEALPSDFINDELVFLTAPAVNDFFVSHELDTSGAKFGQIKKAIEHYGCLGRLLIAIETPEDLKDNYQIQGFGPAGVSYFAECMTALGIIFPLLEEVKASLSARLNVKVEKEYAALIALLEEQALLANQVGPLVNQSQELVAIQNGLYDVYYQLEGKRDANRREIQNLGQYLQDHKRALVAQITGLEAQKKEVATKVEGNGKGVERVMAELEASESDLAAKQEAVAAMEAESADLEAEVDRLKQAIDDLNRLDRQAQGTLMHLQQLEAVVASSLAETDVRRAALDEEYGDLVRLKAQQEKLEASLAIAKQTITALRAKPVTVDLSAELISLESDIADLVTATTRSSLSLRFGVQALARELRELRILTLGKVSNSLTSVCNISANELAETDDETVANAFVLYQLWISSPETPGLTGIDQTTFKLIEAFKTATESLKLSAEEVVNIPTSDLESQLSQLASTTTDIYWQQVFLKLAKALSPKSALELFALERLLTPEEVFSAEVMGFIVDRNFDTKTSYILNSKPLGTLLACHPADFSRLSSNLSSDNKEDLIAHLRTVFNIEWSFDYTEVERAKARMIELGL